MSVALGPLSGSPHVLAAAIFDESGQCTESHLPPPYDPILIQDMIVKLGEAFDNFSALGHQSPARSFAASCEAGSVIMRRIEGSTIVALVEKAGNMVMVNVALNVVGLKLRRGAEASKSASDHFLSPSASASLGQSGSFVQATNVVPRAALQRLLKLYQHEVGPAAKLLLKRELSGLGLSARALRPERYPAVVRGLALHIQNPELRDTFIRQSLDLVPRDSMDD